MHKITPWGLNATSRGETCRNYSPDFLSMKSRFLPKHDQGKVGLAYFYYFSFSFCLFTLFPHRKWHISRKINYTQSFRLAHPHQEPSVSTYFFLIFFVTSPLARIMKQDNQDSHLVIITGQQNSHLPKLKTQVPFRMSSRWQGEQMTKTDDECAIALCSSETGFDMGIVLACLNHYHVLNTRKNMWRDSRSKENKILLKLPTPTKKIEET